MNGDIDYDNLTDTQMVELRAMIDASRADVAAGRGTVIRTEDDHERFFAGIKARSWAKLRARQSSGN